MTLLQPLTTGQLLDRVFSIYRKNFLLFAGIAALPQIAFVLMFGGGVLAPFGGMVVGAAVILISALAYLGLIAVAQGAVTVGVSDIYLSQPTSIGGCYRRVRKNALRLVGLMIGYGLIVGLGFLLLIIPGVYFLVTYALAVPAMALENLSFSSAMSRSKDLTAGQRTRIGVIYLMSLILSYAIAFGLLLPVEALGGVLKESAPILAGLLSLAAQIVANILATPIGLIGFTLAYYDARVRKEAFDLHHMMDSGAAVGAAGAATS